MVLSHYWGGALRVFSQEPGHGDNVAKLRVLQQKKSVDFSFLITKEAEDNIRKDDALNKKSSLTLHTPGWCISLPWLTVGEEFVCVFREQHKPFYDCVIP